MGRRTGSESGRCCQRCRERRGGKPSSSKRGSTNLLPPRCREASRTGRAVAATRACPRAPALCGNPSARADGIGPRCRSGAGEGSGPPVSPLACTEWPGGGELDGTQKGHREGATPVTERRDCSRGAASPGPFQPLIPCDMLWGMTGCGGRGELAVWRGRLREKSKGEKCYSKTTLQLNLGDLV